MVLVILYGVLLYVEPDARPWKRSARSRPVPREARPRVDDGTELAGYDMVVVTLEIPAAADVPRGGTHGGNCPQDQLCNILGVRLARTHGLVVGSVVPDGPADRAGIVPGDMLGNPSMCPSTVLPTFRVGAEAREMELTVRRPRGEEEEPSAPDTPPQQEGASE